ncbi:ESPR-type extended signal peptide-containing protein [Veillonella sp. YH-vei2233]|uniref:ESPR-type extended signal peptide-containing protein n=2 Tax=Veillonella absiana TaxID=3079305 RepID=A0ABU3ZB68_9FIRM|nr:ESPR-type extended signal peptide-containing protein [Veillonella sp. YH-vei2233]MDV5089133.1 ESPR-type extended signal peptide-containing protein [Veillonella sp. YH-vei2233]
MNKIYKVIYNKSLQMYQVVSELAKGQGKVNVSKRFRQGRINAEKAFLTAIVIGVLSSTVTFAAGVVNNGDTITGGTNVTVNETGTTITVGLDPAVATDAEVTAAVNALASGQVATNQADIATLKTTTTQQGTAIGNLQSADTNLQNQITANETANDTKNSQQDTTIAANKSASEAADTALSNRINTINTLNTTLGLDVTKPGLKYFRANSTEADAIAGGTNSIAVGPKAETKANAERSVAIGYDSTARAAESVVIGDHATSQGSANKSVAIGNAARTGSNTEGGDTTMDGAGSPVLGDGTSAIAVGDSSIARGERVIAIGKGAATYNRDAESRFSYDSMAIGTEAIVIAADNAIALGKNAKIAKNADSSVAIGDTAVSSGKRAVALGVGATAGGVSSLALGDGANSTQDNTVAIGKGSKAYQTDTVAIGDNATALTTKTISIGLNAGAGQAADATGTKHSHINIGENAGANVNGQYNIGIGYNAGSGVSGKASIAMGVEAGKNLTNQPETVTDNVSIGNKANSYASATSIEKAVAIGGAVKAQTGSVGIGYETNAQGKQAVALGFQASTTGDQGVAVGYSAKADANNVALGSNSVATKKTATGYLTGMASESVVSVGSKDTNTMRRIVNVADGADDQDAATVAQLKKVKDKVLADVNTAINNLPANQNRGITYDAVNSSSTTADASISLKNDTGKGTRISNVSNPVTDMDAVNLQTLKAAVKEGQPKYFSANNQGGDYGNADNANATGKRSLAIGQTVQATAENSVAVGNDANAYGIGSIAIGSKYVGNAALDDGATDLSSDTSVSKQSQDYRYGIAIGAGAITEGNNSLAIGSLASVTNQNIATGTVDRGVAVGYRARSSADKANAIGDRAIASGKMASAMGSESLAAGTSSIAIGTKAQTGAENDIAIGTNQSVTGKNSGSIGYAGLETDANKTVITGEGTYSLGNTNSRVVGAESGIFGNSNSINAVTNVRVVGNTNKIGEITPASGAQAPDPNTATPVTYLKDIYVNGYNNKISSGSKLAKDLSGMFVLGHDNEVANITDPNAPGELAITDSTVIGARNKVNTEGASYFVLGNDVTATLANSVYLGSKSAYTVKGASTAGNTNYASEVLNGQARNFAGGTNLAGVVTVGAPGAERRIQNVGAGLINATSTDAINGSQLYQFTLPLRFAGDNSTIGSTAAADVNVIKRASDQAMSILGGATNLSDNNIGVVADAATNKMTVKLSKELKNLTSVQTVNGTKTTTMTGDGTTVKDGANVTTVTAAGTTVTNNTKKVTLAATGLDNGNNQIVNVASGLGGSTLENASGNTLNNATNVDDLKQAITNITAKGTGYGGDAGTAFINPLGQQTNVKGGITDTNKLTDGNIGVVSDAGSKTLNVKLAKDLQGLNSVTTTTPDGKTNVMNSSGNTVTNGTNVTTVTAAGTTVTDGNKKVTVTVTANGLDNGGNKFVNVASGLDGGTLETASGSTLTNAANIRDLQTAITNLDTTLTNKGTGYGGDAGTAFVTPLGEQTNIKGGVTDPSKLSDGNIGVVADATTKTLNVKLAKDLQGLNSVTTTTADGKTNVMNSTGNTITDGTKVTTVTAGSTTVKDGNNVTTISSTGTTVTSTTVTGENKTVKVTANGLDNGGNKVVNVASGLDGGTLETASGLTLTNAANIGDLKTAVNNITDAGFGLKDEAGNVINQKLGTAIQVTGDSNIDTKVVDAVDANGEPTGGKALQVSLNNELEIGKAGADGKDGKIGVNGKDGSGVVINGKDGSIGLNGAKGANGLTIKGADGKAGVDGAPGETKTRITYEYTKPDGTTGTEKVATLNDGMKYGGDLGTGGDASKQVIKKKLNEQVNVVGGITDMKKVADVPNIAVIADGTDNLTLRLAKDLQGLTSVTTTTPDGKTNVMNGTGNTMTDHDKVNTVTAAGTTITDGTKKVTLTADGLNNGDNQITNVASGYATGETIHNVSDASKSNAATIGDLTKVVDKTVGGFGLIDKEGTEYKEDLGKSIKVTGDDNINTKFIDYTTTENGQQVTKKALQVSLADDITIGKPGADGKDGKITVTGKDGNAVVIDGKDGAVGATGANGASAVLNGKDGSLGLTGPNGENGISIKGDQGPAGVNGADGEMKTRMVYEYKDASGQPVKETVATLNDGMKYGGDTGTNLAMKLNEKVNIVGGITDESKLAQDPNIGVVADGTDTLKIKLAKNLKGLESVQTGDTTMNSDGLTIINGPSITKTGIDAGDMNITNVAPGLIGPNSKDAINGSQLWDTNQKVSKLGNQINRVGAGAAALSALHPLDFDPDDKWDITAGYGNYKGAHALALGTFYRPNESTMFSLGASIGGGENMVNAGISVKLGQGNNVTTSRVAMAKEIIDLRDDNKELRKQVEEINNRLNSLLGILDMNKRKDFPDVPDNHWAYNYVATLAGNGLVEGYPDGTFGGDRTMTRYEFAAIIYRALKNGAPVDENMDRAMNEFEPELRQIRLDRIRVDRISGNDTDKYKVERVRVNNKDNEEKNDYRDIYGSSIPKPIVETEIAE